MMDESEGRIYCAGGEIGMYGYLTLVPQSCGSKNMTPKT